MKSTVQSLYDFTLQEVGLGVVVVPLAELI